MAFSVYLTDDAVRDLEDLFAYVAGHDGRDRAEYVLARIEKAVTSLTDNPHSGAYPRELLTMGIREYREIFFKPYRLIYRVVDDRVYVLLVADGRRDMQTLLQRRLLQA